MDQKLNDKNGQLLPFGTPQQPQQIRVNLEELKDVACTCKGLIFTPVKKFKVLPALLSPSTKPILIPIECIQCTACGAVFPMEDVMKSIA